MLRVVSGFFRATFTLLQVLAFIAAIISAVVAVIVLLNYHRGPNASPRQEPPGIYVGERT